MAKKRKYQRPPGRMTRHTAESVLPQAIRLLESLSPENAVEQLTARVQRSPADTAARVALAQALALRGEYPEAVDHLRRALARAPRDPGILLDLAMGYARMEMVVHAARTLRECTTLYPQEVPAGSPAVLDAAAETVANVAQEFGVSEAAAETALYWLQEGRLAIMLGRCVEALAAADRSLEAIPGLIPALNNRAAALTEFGRWEEAMAILRRVADEMAPENLHATATLVRFSTFLGDAGSAAAYARQLRPLEPEDAEARLKKADALAWVQDDQGIYDTLHAQPNLNRPGLRLLATAATNLGKRQEATRLWKELQAAGMPKQAVESRLEHVRKGNAKPVAYHTLVDVLTQKSVVEIVQLRERADAGNEKAARQLEELIARTPQAVFSGRLALDDPITESVGVGFLGALRTPEALQALREFVTGKVGSAEARKQAGQTLSEAGAVKPDESLPFWTGSEFQPVTFRVFQLVDEPAPMPSKARPTAARAAELVEAGRADEAIPLLEDLVRRFPNEPVLHNDLGAAYGVAGRREEGIAERLRAIELDPFYVRARVFLAHLALAEGDVEKAREWIRPLHEVKRFRRETFVALLFMEAEVAIAEKQCDQARQTVEMIRQIAPKHPDLEGIEAHLQLLGNWDAFWGRFDQNRQRKRERARAKLDTREPSLEQALALFSKDDVLQIARNVGMGGLTALKKAALGKEFPRRLVGSWEMARVIRELQADEREALAWVLDAGGSVPLAEFCQRYQVECDDWLNLVRPESLLERMVAKMLLVETAPAGTPHVCVPAELREGFARELTAGGG